MVEPNNIYNVDCLEGMNSLADKSVDTILCDLPYGTTANKWDSVIPMDALWKQYRRIIKANGVIVLTSQMPFTAALGASNLSWFRHEWIWEKNYATGFLNAKKAPLKSHENILVFSPGKYTYNAQMERGDPYKSVRRGQRSTNYRITDKEHTTINVGTRYPKTVLRFKGDTKNRIHPTQKPVALFEYLIRTYTHSGELVLDNCIGSGTTAIACLNTDRRYIGLELDPDYFQAAQERISRHQGSRLSRAPEHAKAVEEVETQKEATCQE